MPSAHEMEASEVDLHAVMLVMRAPMAQMGSARAITLFAVGQSTAVIAMSVQQAGHVQDMLCLVMRAKHATPRTALSAAKMDDTPVLLPARLYSAPAVKRSSSTACLSTIVPGTSLSEEYVLSSVLLTSACNQHCPNCKCSIYSWHSLGSSGEMSVIAANEIFESAGSACQCG